MTTEFRFSGEVVSGSATAVFFTRLDWVRRQCRHNLGFDPFPGTLNLRVFKEHLTVVEALQRQVGIELVPPTDDYCSANAFPVTVVGIVGALIIPEKSVRAHGRAIVEIMAPVRLKDALGIADGDAVEIVGRFQSPSPYFPFPASDRRIRVEAVMFDLDGTLIDSTEVYCRIIEVVLERLGMPVVSRGTILDAARGGDFDWRRVLPADTGGSGDDLIKAGWDLVQEVYPDMFKNGVDLVPGAASTVRALAAEGVGIGIVTSTPRNRMEDKLRLLAKANILDVVGCVITADDTALKKPAPDPLIACGRQLGVRADKNVYVGDTQMDILAGRAAGMRTIGVLTGFDGRPVLESANPDAILASVADLERLLMPSEP